MNTIVKSDVAIFAYLDPEKATDDARKIAEGGAKRRVVQVHLSPSQDGRTSALYFPIVEGLTCPCCQQKIAELVGFDGNDHHTEDRALEQRMAEAGG